MKFYSVLMVGALLLTTVCQSTKKSSQGVQQHAQSQLQVGVANQEPKTVTWISFQEAVEKSKSNKRPIFIDVYTDWCGWCKEMDRKTFSDPKVAKLLSEKFYTVKFNAEQREDVSFNGTTYKFVQSGRSGYHELAAALLNNRLSYPTVVFLDENFGMISPVAGYREAPEFHMIAEFIGDGYYKTTKLEDFKKEYKSPY